MNADIVERLRAYNTCIVPLELLAEAADEIVRAREAAAAEKVRATRARSCERDDDVLIVQLANALGELVELHDLKESWSGRAPAFGEKEDYERRKPLAWNVARALVQR